MEKKIVVILEIIFILGFYTLLCNFVPISVFQSFDFIFKNISDKIILN